jgi:hypothetical protein
VASSEEERFSLDSIRHFAIRVVYFMQSAIAGPGLLLHVADSISPFFEMPIDPPGQVTAASFSPGLQLRSQLLPAPQAS